MKTSRKLCLAIVLLIVSFPLLRFDGWFGLGIPVGLLVSILYWFDLGRELRQAPFKNRCQRRLGVMMGVPQALFGILSMFCGLAIILWVLYNTFWYRDPAYSGGFLTFGGGPLLTAFGAGLLMDAFGKSAVPED